MRLRLRLGDERTPESPRARGDRRSRRRPAAREVRRRRRLRRATSRRSSARYDGIVIRSATKLTADLINAGTNLKVIGRAGVGVDNVDVDAATRRGIVVANAPESNIVSAAEHTVGLLFALARNIPQAHSALVDNRWERSKWGGVELAEKTLGVLGFGRIGQQVARRGARDADARRRLRPVRLRRALSRGGRRAGHARGRARPRRLRHAPPAAERRDARRDRRRGARADEARCAADQRRPGRARRRGGADRRARVGPARRRRDRRLLARSRTRARCSARRTSS